MPIDFGQTRVDERLLATMSDLQRHIFFRHLEQTKAARLKGKLAFEIAQAVMDWGKPVDHNDAPKAGPKPQR